MKKINFIILFYCLMSLPAYAAVNHEKELNGKILLQVESQGEAWYVNPSDEKRYYLGRPDDAFKVMRELGLGITNISLEKIATSQEKKQTNIEFSKKFAGKILLQVEKNGEAWYVNPTDLKRYFLGRPVDAFNVMRKLGLGISDKNLSAIPVFENKNNTAAQTNEEIAKLRKEVEDLKQAQVLGGPSNKTINTGEDNVVLCNGKSWTNSCAVGTKFYCPAWGDATCAIDDAKSNNNLFCNNKRWLPCGAGTNFYCPTEGDPQCLVSVGTQNTQPSNTAQKDISDAILESLDSIIKKNNESYQQYLKEQQEINEKLKPLEEEQKKLWAQIEKECPIVFMTGQKKMDCDLLLIKVNDLTREESKITGIYPNIKSLPSYQLPPAQQWRIDRMPGTNDGKIWSPDSSIQYRYSCSNAYSCIIDSY
ncbi:MAG: hypothetical protein Q8Q49_05670 [bacterium]|nr:hypothetical protein [bacterium]